MIRRILFGSKAFEFLKGGLNASALRGRIIASNLANVQTPGYQARRVVFEELLDEANASRGPRATHPLHAGARDIPNQAPSPKVVASRDPVPPGSVNNVDIEQELVRLGQNEIHFRALSELLARKYQAIRSAIGGR